MFIWLLVFGAGITLGVAGTLGFRRLRRRPDFSPTRDGVWRTIAVPLINGVLPRAALAIAARLSRAGRGHVVLLAIAPVPRTMTIEAEAAPGLDAALQQIEAAEAILRDLGAEGHGLVLRVREATDAVRRACEELAVDLIVIEPSAASRGADELFHALTDPKRRLSFDLIVARGATVQRPAGNDESPASSRTTAAPGLSRA